MKIPVQIARELTWMTPPSEYEGFTVIENRALEEKRWNMVMELVVRDGKGLLFRALYERGLTESQESRPFEYQGDSIEFRQVRRRTVEAYVYEDDE